MSDLVRGKYPVTNDLVKLTGGANNSTQGNIAARSNGEWLGFGTLTDGALAATGVACAVAVPVEYGDVVSSVTILVGATAGATMTHQWAALYSGVATPALLAQSTDGTSGAIAASGAFTFTLASPVVITPAIAPNGFVYVSVMVAASTVPTAATVATPTAVGYQWFSNGPAFLSATHGSSLAATAPATIASPAAKAVAPVVFLR